MRGTKAMWFSQPVSLTLRLPVSTTTGPSHAGGAEKEKDDRKEDSKGGKRRLYVIEWPRAIG